MDEGAADHSMTDTLLPKLLTLRLSALPVVGLPQWLQGSPVASRPQVAERLDMCCLKHNSNYRS